MRVLLSTFLIVLAVSAAAHADTITPVDLNSILYPSGDDLGSLVPGTLHGASGSVFSVGTLTVGMLNSAVYLNGSGVYTYVLSVTPLISGDMFFSTGYVPTLFNGMAGWNFNEAAPGSFTMSLDQTGLSWRGSDLSTTGKTIDLFFQTTVGGGLTSGSYNLGSSPQSSQSTWGFAPNTASSVPEPSALLDLCSFGFVLGGFWLARRVSSCAGTPSYNDAVVGASGPRLGFRHFDRLPGIKKRVTTRQLHTA
jgi:hypothetical protein